LPDDALVRNTDLPTPTATPRIFLANRNEVGARLHQGSGTTTASGAVDVIALYDPATRTIILGDGWTGTTAAEVPVLVHEMVHHMQAAARRRCACPGEREAMADAAQEKWPEKAGESPERGFRINDLLLNLATICGI